MTLLKSIESGNLVSKVMLYRKLYQCKRSYLSTLLLALCLYSAHSIAWGSQYHNNLFLVALEQLPVKQQHFYAELFTPLKSKSSLNPTQSIPEQFAFVGGWADKNRNRNIEDLFKYHNAPVPDALKSIQNTSTKRWHYHNAPFRKGVNGGERIERCNFVNKGKLHQAIDLLDYTLNTKLTANQAVVVLALQIHFIQDAHQPLHNITYLNEACKSDLGGNLTCTNRAFKSFGVNSDINQKYKKNCEHNLHQLWDRGFGVLDVPTLRAIRLHAKIKSSVIDGEIDPQSWTDELFVFAPKIYLEDGNYFSNQYQDFGKKVVTMQAEILIERLISYLTHYYNQQKSG